MNLIVVFLATGIWHGAAWTFLVWGIYHGFFILLERIFLKKYLDRPGWWALPSHIYAMLAVVCGWVLFRAETLTQGFHYLRAMFVPAASSYDIRIFVNPLIWSAMAAGFLFSGVLTYILPQMRSALLNDRQICGWDFLVMPVLLILSIISLLSNTYNPFIYFRF